MLMKQKKNRRLNNIIFFNVFVTNILIFTIGIGVISYLVYSSVVDTVSKSRVDILKQVAEKCDEVRRTAMNISNNVYNETVNDLLANKSLQNQTIKLKLDTICKNNNIVLSQFGLNFSTMVIMKNGFEYSSGGKEQNLSFSDIKNSYWYSKVFSNNDKEIWAIRFTIRNGKTEMVFSYGKIIRGADSTYEGVILVNLAEGVVNETYSRIVKGNNLIYILDEKGQIISHSNTDLIGWQLYDMNYYKSVTKLDSYTSVKKSKKQVVMSNYYDPETKWTIVEGIDLSSLLEPYKKIGKLVIFIMMGVVIISIFTAYTLSKYIAKPLSRLTESMSKAGNAKFELISEQSDYYEVSVMNKIYNEMITKIQDLIRRIKYEEKLKRKTELDFLQAQINPHFLHNTLISIKCLVAMGMNSKAEGMLECFISMLKIPITPKIQFITLEEEIKTVENYIRLMEYRYENKFKLLKDIHAGLNSCMVPRLILQPIVENAIFHGFEDNQTCGIVIISARKENNKIIITISDNGSGMTPGQIDKIWQDNPDKRHRSFNQVGLKNIRDRIKAIYGDECDVSFESKYGEGTSVILTLGDNIIDEEDSKS